MDQLVVCGTMDSTSVDPPANFFTLFLKTEAISHQCAKHVPLAQDDRGLARQQPLATPSSKLALVASVAIYCRADIRLLETWLEQLAKYRTTIYPAYR